MGICPAIYIPGYKNDLRACARGKIYEPHSHALQIWNSRRLLQFFYVNLRRTFNHVASLPPQARESVKIKIIPPFGRILCVFSWAERSRVADTMKQKKWTKNDVAETVGERWVISSWSDAQFVQRGFLQSHCAEMDTHTYKYIFDV